MNTTKVLFRVWPNGEVIALFPEVPADEYGVYCSSYEHVGQHGAADATGIIGRTRPARPEQYASLKRELESKPYEYRFAVVQRLTQSMLAVRKAESR